MTVHPLLIGVFCGYGAAFLLSLFRLRRTAFVVFGLAAAANAAAAVHRGVTAGHFPFSNMYETMVSLAACVFPLAWANRRSHGVDGGWIDPLLALVILFPSAFGIGRSFQPEIRRLPPILQSPFFFPHVLSYLVAYAAMARAFLLSLSSLWKPPGERERWERASHANAMLGFPLMTLGLLLGAFWAKYAWGDYWSWDPKEVWSLITWFTYLLYFHVRLERRRSPRWSVFLLGLGFAVIVVTLFVVNLTPLFGGLHAYA